MRPMPVPRLDDFMPLLQRDFTLHLGTDALPLRLMEATPLPAAHGVPGRLPPFQLLFHLPGFQYPPQGTYRLSAAPDFDQPVFLVPVGQDQDGVLYQAVFN